MASLKRERDKENHIENTKKVKREPVVETLQRHMSSITVTPANITSAIEQVPNGSSRLNSTEEVEGDNNDSDDDSSGSDSSDSASESESESSSDEDQDQESRITLTETETFELTAGYRELDNSLQQQRTEVAKGEGVKLVTKSLTRADELFSRTKTSIQASIVAKDSATLREIGAQAKLVMRNLKLGRSDRNLDFNEFARNFVSFFSTARNEDDMVSQFDNDDISDRNLKRFDWRAAGMLFTNCSKKAATMDFLLGPLEIKKKVRSGKVRAADDSKSSSLKTANKKSANELMDKDKQDDTTLNTERCFQKVKDLRMEKIPLFEFFINPNSFAKSVENLFYTSFLFNHGKIILGKDENGLPYIQEATPDTWKNHHRHLNRDDAKSHIIFKMDQDTWSNLVKTYKITEPYLD